MKQLSNLLNLLFPASCPICNNKSDSHLYNPLCTACWGTIERHRGPACQICGIPTISPHTTLCGNCIKSKPPFSKVIYYGIYKGKKIDKNDALSVAIRLFKYRGIKRLESPLAMLLSLLDIPKVDAIIPVPLHKKRLLSREYNQSALLAHQLSHILEAPIILNGLIRTKNTPPQSFCKDIKERQRNVRGAFRAENVKGLDLLLVDDIVTEKATITECSKTLMNAGAKSITVIALAHSLPKDLATVTPQALPLPSQRVFRLYLP